MSVAGLLDLNRRALSVQTQAIQVVSDNISNVNTPGYSRRKANIVSTESAGVGSSAGGTGVLVESISRIVDDFLTAELRDRISDRAKTEIREEFLQRAESPFALDNEPGRLGYQLTEFFASLEDLQTNPADIPLRTQVLEDGGKLAESIRQTYNQLSQLQRETDQRIVIMLGDVNRITSAIASVNGQIASSESVGNQESLTLRDQRDQLLKDLSEILSFTSVENSDGQVTVSLSSGFALVTGSKSMEIEATPSPSFAPVGGFAFGLDGASLNHIVYDYGNGGEIDLTNMLRAGGGELAGLLSLRGVQPNDGSADTFDCDGELVKIASYVESIARDLLVRFNTEYLGPDENTALAGFQPSSRDLDGNPPDTFGLFSFDGAVAANHYGDVDNDGIPEAADLTSLLNSGFPNFASILNFNVETEREFAAARDLDSTSGAVTTTSGDDANVVGLLTQREILHTYTLGGMGTPSFSVQSEIEDMFNLATSYVGSLSRRASDDVTIYSERESQLDELSSSLSGVNIDEEFAKLINYQRAFQASSKLIKTADDLLATIMEII